MDPLLCYPVTPQMVQFMEVSSSCSTVPCQVRITLLDGRQREVLLQGPAFAALINEVAMYRFQMTPYDQLSSCEKFKFLDFGTKCMEDPTAEIVLSTIFNYTGE